jgi:hypothetical protein
MSVIRAYEAGKAYQHPIGLATFSSSDQALYDTDAAWVSPAAWISPALSCGAGTPACKVNINDSDHSYFGCWNDTAQVNRNYIWENFLVGNQVAFMDPYLVYYPRQNRNLCLSPTNGIGSAPDLRWENFRNNLGYVRHYSRRLNLAGVAPQSALSSTLYCLAQTAAVGAQYLVYAPYGGAFTMDLSAMPSSRRLAVEWFNPATGLKTVQGSIAAGSFSQSFTPPFNGDAVLYLADTMVRITDVRDQGESILITWAGSLAPYVLQYTDDLTNPNWIPFQTNQVTSAFVTRTKTQAFFRVATQSP